MCERKRPFRFYLIDNDLAINEAGYDSHIAERLHRHFCWLVLLVMPYVLFEEGHVFRFARDLTFEADVDEIISQEFVQFDRILFQKRRSEALLELKRYRRRCLSC